MRIPEAIARTVAPTDLPWTVAEVAEHLRVTDANEYAMIDAYLRAATEAVENYTHRSLITQTWQAKWNGFGGALVLLRPPFASVSSISYLDTNGDSQVLATTVYRAVLDGDDAGFVELAYGQSWPSTRGISHDVTVTYVCGYGSIGESVPAGLRQAVFLQTADYYENRDSIAVANVNIVTPVAAEMLAAPFIVSEATG